MSIFGWGPEPPQPRSVFSKYWDYYPDDHPATHVTHLTYFNIFWTVFLRVLNNWHPAAVILMLVMWFAVYSRYFHQILYITLSIITTFGILDIFSELIN